MNERTTGVLYPARYFDASPTWFSWNKLTAADVYQLRDEPGFAGQKIWFWLNYPIRFVRLVGLICQYDLVGQGRYVLMTLDDGSGANIEIKVERLQDEESKTQRLFGTVKEYTAETTVDSVYVMSHFGVPTVRLDGESLELGTVVKAEGEVESYNGGRQLVLERIAIVKDTNMEAVYWSRVAAWKRDVVSKPWVLSGEEMRKMDEKMAADQRKELKKEKRKKKWQIEHDAKKLAHEERQTRKLEALREHFNEGALPGSEKLTMPWDHG